MGEVILLVLLLPLVGGLLLAFAPRARERRWVTLATYLVTLALLVTSSGETSPWRLDPLGRYFALVTTLIGGYVTLFAARQWSPRRRDRAALAVSGLVVSLVLSSDLASRLDVLVLSFVGTGLVTLLLLQLSHPTGRVASSSVVGLLLGDGALLLALLISGGITNSLDGGRPVANGGVLFAGACLAALGRAGAGSRRSWVVDTVKNPTAVSALLHAGVVNGGAILLIRLVPLGGRSRFENIVLAAACVVQLVWWAPVIRRRADLKGQLAASTVSQMTFMVLTIALGWPLLALTHLAGHALYKSTRFMNAAGSIRRRSLTPRPSTSTQSGPLLTGVLAGLLLLGALVVGVKGGTDVAALEAVLLPGAVLLVRRVSQRDRAGAVLLAGLSTTILVGYGLLVGVIHHALAPNLSTNAPLAPWWSVGALVLIVALLTRPRRRLHHSAPAIVPATLIRTPA